MYNETYRKTYIRTYPGEPANSGFLKGKLVKFQRGPATVNGSKRHDATV